MQSVYRITIKKTLNRWKIVANVFSPLGNAVSALESSLGEIREIYGKLKVSRSYSLVSLMFFKKLKKIIGLPLPEYKWVCTISKYPVIIVNLERCY